MTRKDFIGGLCAAGTLGAACRVCGVAERFGKADLIIGLLSDIHISLGPKTNPIGATWQFRHALEYFRDRRVDGVLVSGDLTHLGLETELKAVADAWFSVFPEGKLPDGSPVANLMLYGDHDAEERFYSERLKDGFAKAGVPLPRSLSQGELRRELWEECFKEPWSPVRHVKVKGYDFILSNFMREGGRSAPVNLGDRLAAMRLDPARPFFYSQHRYIGGTYLADEEMWGHDNGVARKVLPRFPNCIALTGHTHYMLTDDRNVWAGEFVCINNGALKDAPCGRQRENGVDIPWYKNDYMRDTQMPCIDNGQGHGGMVFNLYGNDVVLERRDFGCDMPLGPDLVFSVSPRAVAKKAYSMASRMARSIVPEFPRGSKATATRGMGKNRRGKKTEQVTVTFPAVGPRGSRPRAFDYVVRAFAHDGTLVKEKRVYSPGINLPPERDAKDAKCVFALSELGRGPVRLEVAPCNCWRTEGQAISASM